MKATYHKYILDFKRPSGTSRGVFTQKETWFIVLEESGKIQKGKIIEDSMPFSPSSTKIVFNKHGNKIEESWFNTNEGLLLKNTYKYDRKRNIIEQNGDFDKKFSYKYDDKGNKIEEIIC